MTIFAIDTLGFFLEILHFMVPALIVFLVAYFILKKMLNEDFRRKALTLKSDRSKELNSIRLQAYERYTILLERMRLDNLVMRLANPNHTAAEFMQQLTQSITDEFNHNISQQIYVSDQAWQMINLSREDAMQTINTCFQKMDENSKATDLGKSILTELANSKKNMAATTIGFLKKELDLVF
jgi:hypothetical protein